MTRQALPAGSRQSWRQDLFARSWRVALVVATALWIYWPALRGDWLWDDHIDVLQNPVMRDPAGWWKIWLQPTGWHFFPLKTFALWLQWQLWGENTFGYHLLNVALHIVSALLIWRILARLNLRFAWIGGVLFVVHPLAVESVAWIAELKNTLSLPLLLWAFDRWLSYEEARRRTDYWVSLGLFAASLLAKTSGVMFPCVLVLYVGWKNSRVTWQDARGVLPFFAVSFVLGMVTVNFEHRESLTAFAIADLAIDSRIAGAGRAIAFYLGKFFFPATLSPAYPLWPLDPAPTGWFTVWLLVIVFTGVTIWTWKRGGRHVAFGGGFFLINLVPVLGFVPMAYHHIAWVADHFVYLPMLGLIGLTVAGLEGISRFQGGMVGRAGVIGGTAVAILALGYKSHAHAKAFKSEESLWRYAVAEEPDAWLAHFDLGLVLARTGRPEEAIIAYRRTLELAPEHPEAFNNLGNALLARARIDEAIPCYEKATQLKPGYTEAFANLANALSQAGRDDAAVAAATQALARDAKSPLAHLTLADLWLRKGQPAAALPHYEAIIVERTTDAVVNGNYGAALLQVGRFEESGIYLNEALKLQPDYEQARVNLGHVYLGLGRETEAVAVWREVLHQRPDSAAARLALGNLYVRTERPAEARAEYVALLRQNPRDATVHNNLAFALAQLGLFDEAVKACEEAIRLRPDYQEAKDNLVKLRALMAARRR